MFKVAFSCILVVLFCRIIHGTEFQTGKRKPKTSIVTEYLQAKEAELLIIKKFEKEWLRMTETLDMLKGEVDSLKKSAQEIREDSKSESSLAAVNEKECPKPYYGPGCTSQCGRCAGGEDCEYPSGICRNGCEPGFRSPHCNEECEDGQFGTGCEERCHCRLFTEVCDKRSGSCQSGCREGYSGPACQEYPEPGHGSGCNFTCGNCTGEEGCEYPSGICRNGCEPGLRPPYCDTECEDGKFGRGCEEGCHCRLSTEVCDKLSGSCQSGCPEGYRGTACQECEDGIFGTGCAARCHCRLSTEVCDKRSGSCQSGCSEGYRGPACQECEDGRFGPACEGRCHCQLSTEVCDKRSGSCQSGCLEGYGGPACQDVLQSCSDVKQHNESVQNGKYTLMNRDHQPVTTYCDMNTADKEWTVFQRRVSNSENFDRNWAEYRNGFGNMADNFWWGNDNLAAFTSNRSYALRIDLEEMSGLRYYAEYQNFYIEDEDAKYRLHLGTFSGNITDLMQYHGGKMFSTPDQDNDGDSRHCAQQFHSGWWFHSGCFYVNLNGVYTGTAIDGIYWWWQKKWKWTEMKFRSM